MQKLIVLFALVCCSFSLKASDTIYWQTYHLPPILIKNGEDAGQGFIDKTLQLIIERLPEYTHELPITSHARALEDIKSGKPVCHPSLYRTEERQAFALFSNPSTVSPSHRLVSLTKKGPRRKGKPFVNLSRLASSSDWVLGLLEGRSYGQVLDTILLQWPKDRMLTVSAEAADVILKLVAIGRLDATLAYPYEISYFNRKTASEVVLGTALIEGVDPYVVGHIACPKNPWGRQVIQRIDSILETLRHRPEYLDAMSVWWPQERKTDLYLQAVENIFGPATPSE